MCKPHPPIAYKQPSLTEFLRRYLIDIYILNEVDVFAISAADTNKIPV